MEKIRVIVASSNAHKIEEMSEMLPLFELVPMKNYYSGDIEENGKTFKDNALIKAKFIAEKFNIPAIADDSGLCVDALGGAPGIYSQRYSGGSDGDNRKLLLKNMENKRERTARFKCAVCLYFPDGKALFGEGACEGEILLCEEGQNGFGYDSLFYSYDLKKSFGNSSAEEKNSVSHRKRAISDLKRQL